MPANPLNTDDFGGELHDLAMSESARPLLDQVRSFIVNEVEPVAEEFYRLGEGRADRWSFAPGQLELLEGLKDKAKANGLWNFFLPDAHTGQGLKNLDYAYIAMELGKSRLASEALNCSAPDTGNMEVLERVGTPGQKEQWLEPLLSGEIRSAFAMTEPGLASSDARNVSCSAVLDGDEWVINGEKYYISGAGDPRCRIMIVMVKTNPDAAAHLQQSQILVPLPYPGVEIVEPMLVFGHDDAPHGHMHLRFTDVRVPASNLLAGEGDGFMIAQARLGPGRIHHCMRAIGMAERALALTVERAKSRVAFGRPLAEQGTVRESIALSRIEIDQARLYVLQTADLIDKFGAKGARTEISAIKVAAPKVALDVIDRAIQIHGGGGVSDDTPLASFWAHARTLRIVDGPDAVHIRGVAKEELARERPYSG